MEELRRHYEGVVKSKDQMIESKSSMLKNLEKERERTARDNERYERERARDRVGGVGADRDRTPKSEMMSKRHLSFY